MHAYLIVTTSNFQAKEWVSDRAKKTKAVVLDFPTKTVIDAKRLRKSTSLSFAKQTIIFIPNIEQASLPAQNALLKMLEEPQNNINFILHATNKEKVIETIKSRCKIEILRYYPDITPTLDTKDFYTLNTQERLSVVSKISKRPEAKEFIDKVIRLGHMKLKNGESVGDILELAVLTADAIDANANVTLQLTNFVVQIR